MGSTLFFFAFLLYNKSRLGCDCMKTLFIDTHYDTLIMSYISDDKVEELKRNDTRNHSEIAIPTLQELLNVCDAKLEDIDQIIVVNGPGSFTGVRIGVTIAKTIAYTLNIKVKTITSLEAIGVSSKENFDIVAVRDSKGVYSALLKNGVYSDFNYRKNAEFNEFIGQNNYKYIEKNDYDYLAILNYLQDKDYLNPHAVNPIYIKEIDALK